MRAAVLIIFAAARSEPLVEAFDRLRAAFLSAGFGEPEIRFKLSDPPSHPEGRAAATTHGMGAVSSVQRILNRWPELAIFERGRDVAALSGGQRRSLANSSDEGAIEPIGPGQLRLVVDGVPDLFPCQSLSLHFSAPGFSAGPRLTGYPDPVALRRLIRAGVNIDVFHPTASGVHVKDFVWASGRERSTTALRVVEGRLPGEEPPPPAAVMTVLGACGRIHKTIELLLTDAPPPALSPPKARTLALPDRRAARRPGT